MAKTRRHNNSKKRGGMFSRLFRGIRDAPRFMPGSKKELVNAVNEYCADDDIFSIVFRRVIEKYGDIEDWDVSQITDMDNLFKNKSEFNENINNWDVSNVTTMKSMFDNASQFNQPLDKWNVSNVTNMDSMFARTTDFNQPLNSWTVNNVTDMSYMFYRAFSFNQPLDKWIVSNVTNMSCMFEEASNFNQPLNSWDVSNVTNMIFMFKYATSFNQVLSTWNIRSGTYIYYMLKHSPASELPANERYIQDPKQDEPFEPLSKPKLEPTKYFKDSNTDDARALTKAYKKLALIYHPDRCPNDKTDPQNMSPKDCTKEFQKISTEYEKLMSKFKRNTAMGGGTKRRRTKRRRGRGKGRGRRTRQ